MAMNREQKRMLQRQGEVDADGEPVRQKRGGAPTRAAQTQVKESRLFSRQGMHEVRGELRKVAWPTRSETINYSLIVLVAIVVMTTLIFAVDWVFSQAVLKLFNA
jgi:preprotein translocase subunit SecE